MALFDQPLEVAQFSIDTGRVVDGSGSGKIEDVSGRVAQLKGAGADAGDGTANISYELVFDPSDG